jgi:RHS repeat-associated protein
VQGAQKLRLDDQGNLVLGTDGPDLVEHAPVIYQDIGGEQRAVAGRYTLTGEDQVGFAVDGYDHSRPLVIDPSLSYSTFLGAGGDDVALGVAVDGSGSAYVTGSTSSIDSPFQTSLQAVPRGLVNVSLDGGLTWGPRSNGLHGATVHALIFDAAGATSIDAGTDAGVFKSTDGGQTWTSMGTGLNGLGVNALAIAATTPTRTFYAGTTNGLYKSTDAGGTWQFAGLLRSVNALAVRPGNPAVVFAATAAGVFKTADGGNRWNPTPLTGNTAAIMFDPTNANIILAGHSRSTDGGATWNDILPAYADAQALVSDLAASPTFYLGAVSSVYKSTDHGATWQSLAGTSPFGGQSLAVDPMASTTLYVGNSNGLFKSSTGGTDFTLHSLANTSVTSLLRFTVPGSPDQIFAGTVAPGYLTRAFVAKLAPNGSSLTYTAYLDGTNWSEGRGIAVDAAGSAYITGVTTSFDFPTTASAFQRQLDQGTLFSQGSNGTWNAIGMNGLPTQETTLIPDPVTALTLYSINQWGLYKSADGGNTWHAADAGIRVSPPSVFSYPIRSLVIDPTNSMNLYVTTGNLVAPPNGVYKSVDGGTSWHSIGVGLPVNDPFLVLSVSPSSPSVLYGGTNGSGPYKSVDGGEHWVRTNYPDCCPGFFIAPSSADVVYANDTVDYLRSTDGGMTWTTLPQPPPMPFAINIGFGIFGVDRSSPMTVYGVQSYDDRFNGPTFDFYMSADGGNHWTLTGERLGCHGCGLRALLDPQVSGTVYISLNGGLQKSVDSGLHWTVVQLPIGTDGLERSLGGWTIVRSTLYINRGDLEVSGDDDDRNAFVSKLSSDGSQLAYSTYLGGVDRGSEANGIALDGSGDAYITGSTSSNYFPTQNPLQARLQGSANAFVTELSSAGSSLFYSTYLGGNSFDSGLGIAVDASGNAYVAGSISSGPDFPQTGHFGPPGGNSAFVSKISSMGSALVYSDTLGGPTLSGIAVDGNRNAYVTGFASSTFPQTSHFGPPGGGALVAKIDATGGTLVYSDVLFGGSGTAITLDGAGSAYVIGAGYSNFPLQDPLQPNGSSMLVKLDPSGQNLVYSGYFGSSYDVANALVLDSLGNVYLAGKTVALNFPLVSAAQPIIGGGNYNPIDAFVAKIFPTRPPLVDPQVASNSEPPFGDLGNVEDTGGADAGVYVHNGEFRSRVVDLEIPGRGFNWRFERAYRSGVQFDGPLGRDWDFRDNRRLRVVTPNNWPEMRLTFPNANVGDVVRFDGLNRADLYVAGGLSTDGHNLFFTSPNGFFTRLIQNLDRSFTERDQSGTVFSYVAPDDDGRAHITRITDRAGNTMRYLYDSNNQLQHVIDTLGRSIDYVISGGRLVRIQDYLGRTVTFFVNSSGDLQTVTSPAVTGTPNHNDFVSGKTESYTYSSGFGVPRLNHQLQTITAPEEVAASGSARVTVTYVQDSQSPDAGRVRSLVLGGTNASNVPAGGTITYAYQQLTTTPPPDYDTPVFQTTVTDRNGNQREYRVNKQGNIVRKREFANRGIRPDDPNHFETTYRYNQDYLLLREVFPQGNQVDNVYDSSNSSRFQRGNLLQTTRTPDAARGGDQATIVTKFTYEPIFDQVRTIIDARGNDANYQPPLGTASAQRYTTTFTFDYQEGTDYDRLAYNMGPTVSVSDVTNLLQTAHVPMGLGDVNEDGLTNQLAGNVIRVERPNVQLIAGSNQATIEGTTSQPIVELSQFNRFSQLVERIDPERNVDLYQYYSEQDPNGDGTIENPSGDPNTGGYLKQVTRDTVADARRDSGTNPPPVNIRHAYQYDEAGNVTRDIDGRGIATDYAVNQLNQVVQITHAAAHGLYGSDPTEPMALTDFQYLQRFFYDYNNRVVLKEVQDRGNTSNVQGGPPAGDLPSYIGNPNPTGGPTSYVDTVFKYDMLDKPIETVQEVVNGANPEFLRTKSRYDRNENLVLTIAPAGNATATVYDERDLVFQTVAGTIAPPLQALLGGTDPTNYDVRGGLPATTVSFYDGNRNLVESVAADDAHGSFANDSKHPTGQSTGNNAGNSLVDTNRNWIRNQWAGRQVKIVSGTGANQVATITGNTSDTLTVAALWQTVPDTSSVYVILGDRSRALYDGYDRAVSAVDAVGNQSVTQYDPAGNVVRVGQFGPVGGASPTADGPDTLAQPVSSLGTIQAANLVSSNLLAATEYCPDELNRVYQTSQVLFVNTIATQRPANVQEGASDIGLGALTPGQTQAIPGVTGITILGRVSHRDEFDRNSRQTFAVQDSLNTGHTLYDGAGRALATFDPEGNTFETAYDGDSNIIESRQTDVSQLGGIANEIFLTTNFYDSLNRLQRSVDNLGQTTERRYDSRDDLVALTDAKGPSAGHSNRRVFSDGPRTVDTANLFGNVTRFYVDGLGRQTRQEQILTASGSGDGNHVGATLEGIKDVSGVTESFTPTPDPTQGSGNGIIRTGSIWDANSLQAALLDSQGNITLYLHDNQNRTVAETKGLVGNAVPISKQALLGDRDILTPTAATLNDPAAIDPARITAQLGDTKARVDAVFSLFPALADVVRAPTSILTGYDPRGNVLIREDENKTRVYTKVDAADRTVALRVFRAGQQDSFAGDPLFAPQPSHLPTNTTFVVVGTTKEDFQYNGLSEETLSTDNNGSTSPSALTSVATAYDSLGRVIEEQQQHGSLSVKAVDSAWRADELRSGLTYPNNRVVVRTFDHRDRLSSIADQGVAQPIATYSYMGDRELVRSYPQNGTRQTYVTGTTDDGYDGLGRPVQLQSLRTNSSLIVGFSHGYDRADNKTGENKLHNAVNNEQYAYDSASRLTSFTRPTGQTPLQRQFHLDGVGNWKQVDSETRQHSSVNEIVSRNGNPIRSDDNGNEIDNGTFTFAWDFRNRLRAVARKSDGSAVATYYYDAAGRRPTSVFSSGLLSTSTDYYLDGTQEIEERNLVDGVQQQFVFGADGEPLVQDVGTRRLFYHQNTLGSTFALTDGSGNIVEGYQYDAYGRQTVYKPFSAGQFVTFTSQDIITPGGISGVGNPFLYIGGRLDAETGLYHLGARLLDTDQGRFISRDPLEYGAGDANLYGYTGENPTNATDPSGLDWQWKWYDALQAFPGVGSEAVFGYEIYACWQAAKESDRLDDELSWLRYQRAQKTATLEATPQGRILKAGDIGSYWGDTANQAGQRAAGMLSSRGPRHVGGTIVLIGATVLPGPEDAVVGALVAKYGYRVVQQGGKWIIGKVVKKEVQALAKAEEKALLAEYNAVKKFKNFEALKKGLGSPGEGKVWHHIVEQRERNVERFGAEAIHNSLNVEAVDISVNQAINKYYSSKKRVTGGQLTVREWMNSKSYAEQYEFGLDILRRVQSGKPLP